MRRASIARRGIPEALGAPLPDQRGPIDLGLSHARCRAPPTSAGYRQDTYSARYDAAERAAGMSERDAADDEADLYASAALDSDEARRFEATVLIRGCPSLVPSARGGSAKEGTS